LLLGVALLTKVFVELLVLDARSRGPLAGHGMLLPALLPTDGVRGSEPPASHGRGDGAPAGRSAPGEMVGPPPEKSSGRSPDRPSRFSSMTDLDPLSETTIAPTDAYAAKRANWDDRATVHAASRAYDLDGLVADPSRISSVIAED